MCDHSHSPTCNTYPTCNTHLITHLYVPPPPPPVDVHDEGEALEADDDEHEEDDEMNERGADEEDLAASGGAAEGAAGESRGAHLRHANQASKVRPRLPLLLALPFITPVSP